jgi:hypothetical protein
MSADTSDLSKVDSAVSGVGEDAKAQPGKKRTSSSYPGVMNILDLGRLPFTLPCGYIVDHSLVTHSASNPFHALTNADISPIRERQDRDQDCARDTKAELEAQQVTKHNRRACCPQEAPHHPTRQEDRSALSTRPRSRRPEPEGCHNQGCTRRHSQAVQEEGVYTLYHPQSPIPAAGLLTPLISQEDDELELPVLAGFEWDPEESWTRLIVHQKKEGAPAPKKKGKKGGDEE